MMVVLWLGGEEWDASRRVAEGRTRFERMKKPTSAAPHRGFGRGYRSGGGWGCCLCRGGGGTPPEGVKREKRRGCCACCGESKFAVPGGRGAQGGGGRQGGEGNGFGEGVCSKMRQRCLAGRITPKPAYQMPLPPGGANRVQGLPRPLHTANHPLAQRQQWDWWCGGSPHCWGVAPSGRRVKPRGKAHLRIRPFDEPGEEPASHVERLVARGAPWHTYKPSCAKGRSERRRAGPHGKERSRRDPRFQTVPSRDTFFLRPLSNSEAQKSTHPARSSTGI